MGSLPGAQGGGGIVLIRDICPGDSLDIGRYLSYRDGCPIGDSRREESSCPLGVLLILWKLVLKELLSGDESQVKSCLDMKTEEEVIRVIG